MGGFFVGCFTVRVIQALRSEWGGYIPKLEVNGILYDLLDTSTARPRYSAIPTLRRNAMGRLQMMTSDTRAMGRVADVVRAD